MTASNEESPMDARTYAWNYFSVHAAQRMSVFQFFISLSTAIVGGAVLIAGNTEDRQWSALLFLLLPLLSFIFWRLDRRTSDLIKNAEEALIEIESNVMTTSEGARNPLSLFTNDKNGTSRSNVSALGRHFSYSRSFRYVFVATGVLGVLGALVAAQSPTHSERRAEQTAPALTYCRDGAECSLVKVEVKHTERSIEPAISQGVGAKYDESSSKDRGDGK